MFKLHDIRKTRVWQEAREEGLKEGEERGRQEGKAEGREMAERTLVQKWLAKGFTLK